MENIQDKQFRCTTCGSTLIFHSWYHTFGILGKCVDCGRIYDIDDLVNMGRIREGTEMHELDVRKMKAEIDVIALELDNLPDQPGSEDWQEPEVGQEVKEHLKQCDQLRQELLNMKRQRR